MDGGFKKKALGHLGNAFLAALASGFGAGGGRDAGAAADGAEAGPAVTAGSLPPGTRVVRIQGRRPAPKARDCACDGGRRVPALRKSR